MMSTKKKDANSPVSTPRVPRQAARTLKKEQPKEAQDIEDKHQTKEAQPQAKSYTVSLEGAAEIVEALNAINLNKYAKHVIFSALNENLKPVV